MMKIYLILLFLMLHGLAFGQSAKKLNKQLHADLLIEAQKQDSVYDIFVQERKMLDEHRKKLVDRITNEIDPEDQDLTEKLIAISDYQDAIENLEIDEKDTLQSVFELGSPIQRHYWFLIDAYENPLEKFVLFKFVCADTYIRKEQEFAEKNEILKKLLEKYQVFEKENILQFQQLNSFEQKLTELEFRLDSLSLAYQSLSSKLLKEEQFLQKIYLEAREDYRLNGPKGFSDAYKDHFPDVHLLPREEEEADRESDSEPIWVVGDRSDDETHSKETKSASYPDGSNAMMSYLRHNLVYPDIVKEKGITGRVGVDFVVSETGEISDVRVSMSMMTCPECNKEAVRFIESMPRWLPAEKDGYYVKSYVEEVIWFIP